MNRKKKIHQIFVAVTLPTPIHTCSLSTQLKCQVISILKNYASVLPRCLVISFRLCLLTSIFSLLLEVRLHAACSNKCNRSYLSNKGPIVLLYIFSKAYETIINRKIHKYQAASNLRSPRQCGFYEQRSAVDLAFLTNSR